MTHNTGMWYIARQKSIDKFDILKMNPHPNFLFLYNDVELKNEYQFNKKVDKITPNRENIREISLSIQIKGQFLVSLLFPCSEKNIVKLLLFHE